MNRILNAEEVLDLMLNHISLSRYDQKFFYNLQLQNVLPKKAITSNQAELFKKVVKKYNTQLKKQNYDANELSELRWTLQVVPSKAEFTTPSINIENNLIILKSPYKPSFVQEFREHSVMQWDRDNKLYYTEFGLYKLKIIIDCVCKHYDTVIFDDKIKEIINGFSSFDESLIWNPTLVRINGRLYIAALNENLAEAVKDIPLETSLKTLSKLVWYGITIHKDLYAELTNIYELDDIIFATSREVKHEIFDIDGLTHKLKLIDCDFMSFAILYGKESNEHIEKIISRTNIPTKVQHRKDKKNEFDIKEFNMPVLIKMNSFSYSGSGSAFAAKVVELVNSKPIDLK